MRQLQVVSDGRPVFQTAKADGKFVLGRCGFLAYLEGPDIAVQTNDLVPNSEGYHRTRDSRGGAKNCTKVEDGSLGGCKYRMASTSENCTASRRS